MIKATIISIAVLFAAVGTPLPAAAMPASVNITAGALSMSSGPIGTRLSITPKPAFAITVTTQAGRNITIRL